MNAPLPSRPGPDYWASVGTDLQRGVPLEELREEGYDDPRARRVATIGDVATGSELEPTPEDLFIEKFAAEPWVPHRRGEITLANAGLLESIKKGYRGGGLAAVEERLQKATEYKHSASFEGRTLAVALRDPHDPKTLSVRDVRREPGVMQVLAGHQLFAGSLVAQKWPGSYTKSSMEKKLRPIMTELDQSSDETLEGLWRGAFSSAAARFKHWKTQLDSVESNNLVVQARIEADHKSKRR